MSEGGERALASAACESCGKKYRVPSVERSYRCKDCGGDVRVAEGAAPHVPVSRADPAPKTASPRAGIVPRAPAARASAGSARVRRTARRSGVEPEGVGRKKILGVVGVVAGGLLALAVGYVKLARVSRPARALLNEPSQEQEQPTTEERAPTSHEIEELVELVAEAWNRSDVPGVARYWSDPLAAEGMLGRFLARRELEKLPPLGELRHFDALRDRATAIYSTDEGPFEHHFRQRSGQWTMTGMRPPRD